MSGVLSANQNTNSAGRKARPQRPATGVYNLYGCEIGDETKIGTFVEVQKGAKIGQL